MGRAKTLTSFGLAGFAAGEAQALGHPDEVRRGPGADGGTTQARGATLPFVIDRLRPVLDADPRIAYALVFGSRGRRTAHAGSDVDVAIGLARGARLSAREVGDLVSRLESVAGSAVDIVILDEAGPGVAYRAFRDGLPVITRDARAFAERRARAILEYLDWRPIEEEFTRAALEASQRG
jgi:predicted nucleotidyltransferase